MTTHLLTQNKKSSRPDDPDRCLYRGPNGTSCAVGCLIPDAEYNPTIMEGYSVNLIVEHSPTTALHDLKLLSTLQEVHDSYLVELWPERLAEIYAHYHFPIPEILNDRLNQGNA